MSEQRQRMIPSPMRVYGEKETAFLRGEPIGDFCPASFHKPPNLVPLDEFTESRVIEEAAGEPHGYNCACDACANCEPPTFATAAGVVAAGCDVTKAGATYDASLAGGHGASAHLIDDVRGGERAARWVAIAVGVLVTALCIRLWY